jgi:hypothetical protein
MIERITFNKVEYAIIIRSSFKRIGCEFFTSDDSSQQIGYMNWPKGHIIKPHIHKPVSRKILDTQEVLYIKNGLVRIDFYTEEKKYFKSTLLEAGDVILLAFGGHGFEILKPTEMIEVKQGPYVEGLDKVHFDSTPNNSLNF